MLGNGTGGFATAANFTVAPGPTSVAVGDFNLDGKPDLVATATNITSNNVSILLGNGAGSFEPAANFTVGLGPSSVAVRDLNLDGKPDLAVAIKGSSNVRGFG